jgi:hypothetical protein
VIIVVSWFLTEDTCHGMAMRDKFVWVRLVEIGILGSDDGPFSVEVKIICVTDKERAEPTVSAVESLRPVVEGTDDVVAGRLRGQLKATDEGSEFFDIMEAVK